MKGLIPLVGMIVCSVLLGVVLAQQAAPVFTLHPGFGRIPNPDWFTAANKATPKPFPGPAAVTKPHVLVVTRLDWVQTSPAVPAQPASTLGGTDGVAAKDAVYAIVEHPWALDPTQITGVTTGPLPALARYPLLEVNGGTQHGARYYCRMSYRDAAFLWAWGRGSEAIDVEMDER